MTYPSYQPSDELPQLPGRDAEAHKGSFGSALVVGGSRGMVGAVALAGMAALRGGSGLVRLAVPEVCQDAAAGFEPSYVTVGLPGDDDGRIAAAAGKPIAELCDWATAIACGPGMGRSDELDELVGRLYQDIAKPMIVDADALNALATRPELLGKHAGPRILTPHPGEFARLAGVKTVPADQRRSMAMQLAGSSGAVVVLKGHRTVVTDGESSWINTTGNPGMATGGSGDVLTGLITALVCQGLTVADAARLGVHLHGLAGDLAAAELGQVSLIASDLIRFLPEAMKK